MLSLLAPQPGSLYPSPIAPVWPTVFSASTFGYVDFLGHDPLIGGHKNYSADWFYDWPNARHLYNGSETITYKNGSRATVKYIRAWWGATAATPDAPVHICDLDVTVATVCECQDFPKALLPGIERPDGFVRANMSFIGRETLTFGSLKGATADHYTGPVFPSISPAPFELWQDPATNFPVLFAGPIGYQGDTGTRFFDDVRAYGESRVRPIAHSTTAYRRSGRVACGMCRRSTSALLCGRCGPPSGTASTCRRARTPPPRPPRYRWQPCSAPPCCFSRPRSRGGPGVAASACAGIWGRSGSLRVRAAPRTRVARNGLHNCNGARVVTN